MKHPDPSPIYKEKKKRTIFHPIRFLITLIIVTSLIGVLASVLPAKWNIERSLGLSLLFKWRGERSTPDEVVVISIDRESAERLGQGKNPLTWDREIHARLIDTLSESGAKIIIFDVLFGERDGASCEDSPQDRILTKAIKTAGNVILFTDVEPDQIKLESTQLNIHIEKEIEPLACFTEAALATAPFILPKIPARVDQLWLFKHGAGDIPTIPVVSMVKYYEKDWSFFCEQINIKNCLFDQDSSNLTTSIKQLRQTINKQPGINESLERQLRNPVQDKETLKNPTSLKRIFTGTDYSYLNYYGPPQTIITIPLYEILLPDGKPAPDLNGKVVFVGASDLRQSQLDDFQTVYRDDDQGYDIAGVEIAATAFANLLDGSEIKPLSKEKSFLTLILFSIVIALLFMFLPPILIIPTLFILIFTVCKTSLHYFSQEQLWINLAVPLLIQLPIALFPTLLWRFMRAYYKQRKVTAALRKLLPEDVVQNLVSDKDGSIEGKTIQGVCMFTDASQYTTLSETMQPDDLREFLNGYYQKLFDPVEKQGGFVSDVIGDAMMAIWTRLENTDLSTKVIREKSCVAALQIIENIKAFNKNNIENVLPTRIGLYAGEISLGNVGAGSHYEFRAVGDTVNTASRIENLNKKLGTNILASAETINGIASIISRELGVFILKGKTTPTNIYEIICLADQQSEKNKILIQSFRSALENFRKQDWQHALSQFNSLLEKFPDDGPSQYYRWLCLAYIKKSNS